jgi:hypothetical protein
MTNVRLTPFWSYNLCLCSLVWGFAAIIILTAEEVFKIKHDYDFDFVVDFLDSLLRRYIHKINIFIIIMLFKLSPFHCLTLFAQYMQTSKSQNVVIKLGLIYESKSRSLSEIPLKWFTEWCQRFLERFMTFSLAYGNLKIPSSFLQQLIFRHRHYFLFFFSVWDMFHNGSMICF